MRAAGNGRGEAEASKLNQLEARRRERLRRALVVPRNAPRRRVLARLRWRLYNWFLAGGFLLRLGRVIPLLPIGGLTIRLCGRF
jgi:hypothetical protein